VPLNLSHPSSTQTVFNGGISVDNMSWWFWIKAGMGFAIGAGIVYVGAAILWLFVLIKNPLWIFLRPLTRF